MISSITDLAVKAAIASISLESATTAENIQMLIENLIFRALLIELYIKI
jgi:hypothetical protein